MIKRKIVAMILLATISAGYIINVNGTFVKANEANEVNEVNEVQNYFEVGKSIENKNINELDDGELKIDFEEFEKNKLEYREILKNDVEQITRNYDGVEIIESNLKWASELDLSNNPKTLVLHHIEASRPGQTIPVTDVHQWHLANGWAGIGYHFYVTKTGKIYRGRPENAIGAHAKDFNKDSLGIAVEGKYETEDMPVAQKQAVERLGGYLRGKYNINIVKGHGELMSTSCPGKKYPLNSIRNNILSYPIYPSTEAPTINNEIAIQYGSHVQNEGWQPWVRDGETSGTTGQFKRIEDIKIKLANAGQSSVKYRAHVQNEGWKGWVSDGASAGTKMESKRVEAIEIKLEGEIAQKYDVEYRAHVQDEGWQPWVKNGAIAGSTGKSRRIEGIQIRLVKKPEKIVYQSHIQDKGWSQWVNDGVKTGTVGEAKRIEGIKIKIGDEIPGVKATYRVHGQEYGWQNWVSNGELAGTTGQNKRIEALEIKLEGENAKNHNVEYRVHVENIGWMPWVRNGSMAGTVGESKRIEAIEIKIS